MADAASGADEGRRLPLPTGALVLLVGPSGAGKSSWAAWHFEPDQVLSSDRFRAMVAGDEADQSANADAFRVLHAVVRARLRRGLLTVVDATNLSSGARTPLRRLAEAAGRPTVAVAFELSLERCLRQNAERAGRQVPDDVVRKHHDQLRTALKALPMEGYAAISVLGDADLDRRGSIVDAERGPGWTGLRDGGGDVRDR